MRRRDGRPVWIGAGETASHGLQRNDLRGAGGSAYNEAWLQALIQAHPETLPVDQIEPGFGPLIPLCRELPLKCGMLDNFFATPEGGLMLVEAKLWRNPEARRSAVAQAMDYAAAVFRLSYEELEAAVKRARAQAGETAQSLYEIVAAQQTEFDEAQFVDAVSRNLRRGRAIVAVVGDGIREDLVALADLLQSHAGQRFVFALVELAIYDLPAAAGRIVVPSVLAQTALIERGVVQIEDRPAGSGTIIVREAAASAGATARDRAFGIGEDEFYEHLDRRQPGLAATLKSFLAKAQPLGVYADRQGGLNLKRDAPSGNPLNFGTITKDGFVETGPATWWGRDPIGRPYNTALAAAIGGFVRDMKGGAHSTVRTAEGATPRLSHFLPAHEEAWLAAIERYIADSFELAKEN